MTYSQLTPVTSPVSLAEAKAHARIDFHEDDLLVQGLLDAATEHVQTILGKQLTPATFELHLDGFPSDCIKLTIAPVTNVRRIEYIDADGIDRVFTDWRVAPRKAIPYITANKWPAAESVVVTFDAGFVIAPERARLCIMALVAHWYEARTPTEGNTREVPHHITSLLNTTRSWVLQ